MTHPAETPENSLGDRLFALLLTLLPHHLLSRAMYALTRWEYGPFRRLLIGWAVKHYGIDLSEAVEESPDRYASFNAFFTRELKPESRPRDASADGILSPVDGEVSQAGRIHDTLMVQAKGHHFTLDALLGDSELAARFRDGSFATIYLSPRDYHRIHMPVDGRLKRMIHIPGRLFSVNHATTRTVPGLFARNERVVSIFKTPAGSAAVILVGAIFVGSMDTVWAGTVTPVERRVSRWRYDDPSVGDIRLERGAEMGRFNMGSTVILLFPPGHAAWEDCLAPGAKVRVGERIGWIQESA